MVINTKLLNNHKIVRCSWRVHSDSSYHLGHQHSHLPGVFRALQGAALFCFHYQLCTTDSQGGFPEV